jgi:hypothetical protein
MKICKNWGKTLPLSALVFLFLLLFTPLSATTKVTVGEKFHMEVQVPDEARRSFRTYLETFQATQPCSGYCLLEGFQELQGGRWSCTFRATRPGTFDLPLGVFCWGQSTTLLPKTAVEVSPLKAVSSPSLVLPFFNTVPTVSKKNQEILEVLLQKNQEAGIFLAERKEWWRHATGFLLVVLFSAPFLWNFIKRVYEDQKRKVTSELLPEHLLYNIHGLRQKHQVPWTQLLELLGKLWDGTKSTPTACELREIFAKEGKTELAKIADLIENYGYSQSPHTEQFDEALIVLQPLIPRQQWSPVFRVGSKEHT